MWMTVENGGKSWEKYGHFFSYHYGKNIGNFNGAVRKNNSDSGLRLEKLEYEQRQKNEHTKRDESELDFSYLWFF